MRRAWVGFALVLSGCGVQGGGSSIGELADEVTAQTSSRSSAHVRFEMAGTTGEGAYRFAPGLAADFSIVTPDGPARFIVLDRTAYLHSPARGWVRFTAGGGKLADMMTAQADIGRQLDRLRTAGSITATASETVDDRPTTRYAIDLDVQRLAEAEPDPTVRASLEELRKQGVTRIPYTLWLDDQSLPVKITMDIPGQPVTIHYSRWGDPVEVTAPPPDQVTDAPARG